jgi:hypothetical protein
MKLSVITSTVCVAALAAAVSVQSTPAPTTAKPVSTPATTTAKPIYDGAKGCWYVSVERDATYCITGPICSGSGAQPAGWNCPKKGDVAVERCLKYLKSYVDVDKCVAPVDAECKVIHTGAWGCVLKGDTSVVTPAPTTLRPNTPIPQPTNASTGGNNMKPGNNTKPDNGTIQTPKKVSLSAAAVGGGSAVGTIAAVAGVAAVVCATVGALLYKKSAKKAEENDEVVDAMDVVTP